MTIRNWNNDVTLTKAEGQQCYETKDLIDKFVELLNDGYSGLGLGSIIDIIDNQVPEVRFDHLKK
jgi:hypothetical protein